MSAGTDHTSTAGVPGGHHARATDPELAAAIGLATDPAQVRTRPIDLAAMAHDASHYLLTPQAVVTARSVADVAAVLGLAHRRRLPVTFRSGGTSLSGQASTSGLLVDTRQNFRGVEVLDGGARVRCEPGATVRSVNARLAPYRTKLGPDPASEGACTIGGVVANNSAGMACGTERNSFRTLEALTLVLASGTVIDTGAEDADERLRALEPGVHAGLVRLRDRVLGDPDSMRRIAHQYSMKNTMGYSLNAFTEFSRPVDVLAHLVVGSEGTLGFVASATFRTVPVLPYVATALLYFPELSRATDALEPLLAAGARTLELLDASSLRVSQRDPRADPALRSLQVDQHTALLVELQGAEPGELEQTGVQTDRVIATLPLSLPAAFTTEATARAAMWTLRKGLYTAVAGARPVGTTALLEDVVVPLPELTATTSELGRLLAGYGYDDAVVFGHAKDGNLHFMINPRLDDPVELRRYDEFTEDLVDLILSHDGSLKAEHGTGRIMAPYVQRQFGAELYQVMREVKALLDPHQVLNPGVIITDNPRAHLENLKVVPPVDPAVDRCVECGYCEPVCPSRAITTTPRQRIVLLRSMAQVSEEERAAIAADYDYMAVDTCAVDSLCATACPVAIDTGRVMKGFRADRHGPAVQGAATAVARAWGPVVAGLRVGLGVADHLPAPVLTAMTKAARAVVSEDWVPLIGADLPGPGGKRRGREPAAPDVVFFPACVGSMFGAPDDALERGEGTGASASFLALAERAGLQVAIPRGIGALCCGTPWQSKGLVDGHAEMAARTFDAVWEASRGGALPIVCDASSCTHGLLEIRGKLGPGQQADYDRLTILDSISYVRSTVLDRLTVHRTVASVAVHPTCSTVHLGSTDDLRVIAEACAEEVFVPPSWGCCGFAGDRGLLHPELTASATATEAAEVNEREHDAYVSCNRTCEMGLTRATGHPYSNVLELLELVTR